MTETPISAAVDLAMGDVRITTGAETSIDVRPTDPGDPEDVRAAEQARIDRSAGHLYVKGPKLRSWLSRRGGGSIAVTITLPEGSEVNGTTAMGDVRCEGRLGDCRFKSGLGDIRIEEGAALSLKTSGGDITVERAAGDVDAATASGQIRLRALARGAVVKNSNGDTWVGTADGELRINAANGTVTVETARGGLDARSANGDLRLGEAARGSVALETGLGDVAVGIPDGVAAWLDVNARAGRVQNDLEASGAPDAAADTVEVRARTGMGDILIQRAPAR